MVGEKVREKVREKVKVKLTLDQDAVAMLDDVVTPRKRGWFVSTLIRESLQEEMTVGDVILTLRRFEKTLVLRDEEGVGPGEKDALGP